MPNIQHEHTVSSRVRAATRLATQRLGDLEYQAPAESGSVRVVRPEDEVNCLRSIIHELLEALALL